MDQKTKIHSELRKNESYIREKFENCADILIRPMRSGKRKQNRLSDGLYRSGSFKYDAG